MRLIALSFALLAPAVFGAAPQLSLEIVAEGLTQPVAIAHAGDDRLFIAQQNGIVRVWDGVALRTQPFLDLRQLVSTGSERGLLGLAFHPRYRENGALFVNYTDSGGRTVIARYRVSATDLDAADPASAAILLTIDQPFANHNGGQIAFGPDGYLYIGAGDGGSGGDPGDRAQNLSSLLGKLLRIAVAETGGYATPASNPLLATNGARPEIWAYGLRNPWRFSFDRVTGDLWIADVGQGDWEEVNLQPYGSIGGENYGWRLMEGTHCFNPPSNCNPGDLVLPVIEYGHSGNACSVTGGFVYRGTRYPVLHGTYLYADFCDGRIRGATMRDGVAETRELLATGFLISTFGEDWNGEVYVGDYSGGRILRIVENTPGGSRRRAVRH